MNKSTPTPIDLESLPGQIGTAILSAADGRPVRPCSGKLTERDADLMYKMLAEVVTIVSPTSSPKDEKNDDYLKRLVVSFSSVRYSCCVSADGFVYIVKTRPALDEVSRPIKPLRIVLFSYRCMSEESPYSDPKAGRGGYGASALSYAALNDSDQVDTSMEEDERRRRIAFGECELSNLISVSSLKLALSKLEDESVEEVMSTDKQLMMVIRQITEGHKESSQSKPSRWTTAQDPNCLSTEEEEDIRKDSISFPEFLHCYKTVVNGMMVMQMLPPSADQSQQKPKNITTSAGQNSDAQSDKGPRGIQFHRARTRERVMTMLKVFSVNHFYAMTPTGTLPSLTGEQFRRLLTVKDRQLVRIIEEHTGEIDDIASNMGSSFRRRRRSVIILGITLIFGAWFGGMSYAVSTQGPPQQTIVQLPTAAQTALPSLPPPTFNEERFKQKQREELSSILTNVVTSQYTQQIDLHTQGNTTAALEEMNRMISSLQNQANMHQKTLETSESAYQHCQAHLRYVTDDFNQLQKFAETQVLELKVCESQFNLLTSTTDAAARAGAVSTSSGAKRGPGRGRELTKEEHTLLVWNRDRLRFSRLRSQALAVVLGGAAVVAAPTVWMILGNLGSSFKLVQLVGYTGGMGARLAGGKFIWKISLFDKIFNNLGGAVGVLFKAFQNVK